MKRQFELKQYGKVYPITLEIESYPEGNLGIQMVCWEDGEPEPWSSLTVNLDGLRERTVHILIPIITGKRFLHG